MIKEKVLNSLEYYKVLSEVSFYASLKVTKDSFNTFTPFSTIEEAKIALDKTSEAYKLLFIYGAAEVSSFESVNESAKRAKLNGTLNNTELLRVAYALSSAGKVKNTFLSNTDESIVYLREIAKNLYYDEDFEKEIKEKILSEDAISDNASPSLYQIRKKIRIINERIREKLNSYMRGSLGVYMQENIVTMRGDRYVVPIKAEYKHMVKGLIHDQSASGLTVFIEPEQIIEYNNELKTALIEEQNEIRKILQELSAKTGEIYENLCYNEENLSEIDSYYARAIYAQKTSCVRPKLLDSGEIDIIKGRHPLLNKDKVVPVSVKIAGNTNYLLITGPNTGGKTVTLKLTGLFTVMAASGLFVPAAEDTSLSFFENVFCDVGDEQSIEQSLSTFSSHMKNIIEITDFVNEKSLVLLDEIGAGTDPDEGVSLALAVIDYLISKNSHGIITTHYSRLKEYAYTTEKIENASMEFDALTFAPLYKLSIGIPGASNAIEISKRLGLSEKIIEKANGYMTKEKISFENVLRKAEQSRNEAERLSEETEKIKIQKEAELKIIKEERERLKKELDKVTANFKTEARRLVNERIEEADELLDQIKEIAKKSNISGAEVITARKLKNLLENKKYVNEEEQEDKLFDMKKADFSSLKEGETVYSKKLDSEVKILSLSKKEKTAEVLMGSIKTRIYSDDIFKVIKIGVDKPVIKVSKKVYGSEPQKELNVLGKTVLESLTDINAFLDQAVLHGLAEVKIIHGNGTGKLKSAIRQEVKKDKRVKAIRPGGYGEGEDGVTIITLN